MTKRQTITQTCHTQTSLSHTQTHTINDQKTDNHTNFAHTHTRTHTHTETHTRTRQKTDNELHQPVTECQMQSFPHFVLVAFGQHRQELCLENRLQETVVLPLHMEDKEIILECTENTDAQNVYFRNYK